DDYERRLARRRRIRLAVAPGAMAALALGLAALVGRANRAVAPDVEVEPNNDPAHATLLASGHPVRGKIARRLSREEGDVAVFRIPDAAGGERALQVELSGLPNLDLTLEVFDAEGERLVKADGGRTGDREVLPGVRLGPGDAYIVVRERREPGRVPSENVTDE